MLGNTQVTLCPITYKTTLGKKLKLGLKTTHWGGIKNGISKRSAANSLTLQTKVMATKKQTLIGNRSSGYSALTNCGQAEQESVSVQPL